MAQLTTLKPRISCVAPRNVVPLEAADIDGLPVELPPEPPSLTSEQRLAAMPEVSHPQMIAALIGAGILTEADGIAWITGTLPAAVEAMIAQLPKEQRVIARLRAIRPSSVVPTDPLVAALAAAQGRAWPI